MPKKIDNMKSDELSLVDKGANLKSSFPITKSKDQTMDKDIIKAVLETADDSEEGLDELFTKSEVSDEGKNALKGALRLLKGYEDQIPADALNGFGDLLGLKAPEPVKKAEEVEPVEEPKGEEMDEAIQKQFADMQELHKAEITTLKEGAVKLTEQLEKSEDIRKQNEWSVKVEKSLGHYPGKTPEELTKSLFELEKANPEMAAEHFKVMSEVSENMRKSELMTERGSSAIGGGTAYEKIQKMAKGLVEKDAKLSLEDAEAQVIESNPELYDEYCEREV
ncbi:MAG: hypothetical protein GY847_22370 [Proteobacteria bacterium]|nr:hypothetical protein [Pseudomonadota bacterium]